MQLPQHRLCVYCGSSPGHDSGFASAARALGRELAAHDVGLVYGGGGMGLMGEVARGVMDGGGHVTGVIPEFLVVKERMLDGVNELIVTRSMHERKMAMFERATGFVALPGGIGTLEELAEILTWAQLQQHARPVLLMNTLGFWTPLLSMIEAMRRNGFIRAGYEVVLDVVAEPTDVIPAYHARRAATPDKPPVAMFKGKI